MRKLLGCLAIVALLSGCATTGMMSTTGFGLYTNHIEPVTATGETGSKHGKACTSNILGIVAMGDGSIAAAKRAGGISKVSAVDVEATNILGLYGTACTHVRGN